MNRIKFVGLHGTLFVHCFTNDVKNASHDIFANRHGNRPAGVHDFVSAFHAFGRPHANAAHPVVTEVLLHFECLFGFAAAGHVELDGQRVVNGGKLAGKFHVHDRSDDLNDFAFVHMLK